MAGLRPRPSGTVYASHGASPLHGEAGAQVQALVRFAGDVSVEGETGLARFGSWRGGSSHQFVEGRRSMRLVRINLAKARGLSTTPWASCAKRNNRPRSPAGNMLVVAADVVQAPNDKQQIEPTLDKFGPCLRRWARPKRCSRTQAISAVRMSKPAKKRAWSQ